MKIEDSVVMKKEGVKEENCYLINRKDEKNF